MPRPQRKPGDPLGGELMEVSDYLWPEGGEAYGVFVTGDLPESGIGDGDLLIVDRSLAPRAGDLVVEDRAGGLTVCRHRPALRLAGDETERGDVWGVVTFTIRAVRDER